MRESLKSLIGDDITVAIFHGLGDCVNATTLLKPLRTRYSHIRWLTHERYAAIVQGNPLVDEVAMLDCHPQDCGRQVLPAQNVIVPHYQYQYYLVRHNGSLLGWYRGLRAVFNLPDLDPFEPALYIGDGVRCKAEMFVAERVGRRFVLMETNYGSSQSEWNEELTRQTVVAIHDAGFVPVVAHACNVESAVSAGELHYLEVAALYDFASAFIGVSSGISCLVHAGCFRKDIPHLEFVRGPHWSTAGYSKQRKTISYSIAEAPALINLMLKEIG